MARILEIPWEESRYLKLKYKDTLRPRGGSLFSYSGLTIPEDLKPYLSEDFSYARWLEDDALAKNNKPFTSITRNSTVFSPRDHQKQGAAAILKSFRSGSPGFLLADTTGLGKTLTTLVGVSAIAKKEGVTSTNKKTLLIVCPKGVIPVWRQTLKSYPPAISLLRILVINYQQLNKLLQEPAKAKKAKTSRTKNRSIARDGVPTVNWDYICFDEAHYLKNYPSSSTSMAAASIARLNDFYVKGKSPYVIYSTATPGSSPMNLSIMANFLARLIDPISGVKVTPKTWGEFLAKQGFSVSKGKNGYTWISAPWWGKNTSDATAKKKQAAEEKKVKMLQRKDSLRIGRALTQPGAPFIKRSPTDIAGWPEQQFIPLPIALASHQKTVYDEAWTVFRNWLKLTPANKDPKGALVQNLRYRQKSSLLKVESMIEQIVDYVETGNQVFVSVEFIETLDEYKKKLEAKKIIVSEISGRNVDSREKERLKFQKGVSQVVLCTVVEGISLHAGETLPDGSTASKKPRITLLHDIRQNPLNTLQSAGRAHRSGESSITIVPYFEDTVDYKVVFSFLNKQANLKTMVGDSIEEAEQLETIFRSAV